jgi:uncharacterized protein YqhQ
VKNKDCEKTACSKKTSIGGQALIEGIMMRGPKMTAMAVRNPEGEIVLEKWETKGTNRSKFFKLPLIRGVFGFIDSMRFGYKCLMRSAEIAGLEDEELTKKKKQESEKEEMTESTETVAEMPAVEEIKEETVANTESSEEKKETKETKDTEKKDEEKGSSALMNVLMVVASVLGIVLALVLFVWLPAQLYEWLTMLIPAVKSDNKILNSLIKSVFEGVLRIAILVVYMVLVSRMKDIRRTFMYHGAEHKTIFCYESGLELTVENVKKQRRFHPRCGTSFLILMLIVGIVISFFIDPIFMAFGIENVPTVVRTLIKLLLLPLTMGIGYELIKLAGRHDNAFTRVISAPGMWLQHLTVFEPDDDMIECALVAFKEVIPEDESDKY